MDFKKNPKTKFKNIHDMRKGEARKEIEALREGIAYHNYLYYIKNQPRISDAVYDQLFHRLRTLEDAFPEFQSDSSPTRKVGAEPLDALKKVRHTKTMLSLNASLDTDRIREFVSFIRRTVKQKEMEFILEPKFDGLSVEIVYKKGVFQYGATRGDGEEGEDVSENIKTIGPVMLQLLKQGKNEIPSFLAVRAEVFMRKDDFQRLNKDRIEKGEEPFTNPRNAAAGIMRQLDSRKVADKPLDIIFYEILRIGGYEFSSHWEELRILPEWGLKTDTHNEKCSSFEEMKKYHHKLDLKRDELDYEIDGIVIKIDDLKLRQELGARQRSPRWAMAWKFSPKKEITKLEEIVVQVGRTGILTPVALLQPVDVGGVTVSRATLHNEEEVHKKDLRPGDMVRVVRAGDVIPEVMARIKKRGRKRKAKFSMPKRCPVCDTDVFKEGAYTICPAGLSCPAQLKGHILHYASREAMNIEGMGQKTVERLIEKEFVKDIADLYSISEGHLLRIEGFARRSAQKLHQAIQDAKKATLSRFLYALGIRHVGRHVARVLAARFRSLDGLMKATEAELRDTREVGAEIALSAICFFSQAENREVIRRLQDAGVEVEDKPVDRGAMPLQGKTFVFTGELENCTREEAKEVVGARGGRATSSVSGETDFVVAGERPGSKLDQANRRGIRVLNEAEFQKMLKN